jgi:ABC-type multidrug transport system ATPase subunit
VLPVVTVSGLTKRYGAFTALDAVGCTIRRGEVLGLVGPNGAGKTTLLECLAGLRPFDAGTITIDGQAVPAGTPDGRLFYLPDGIAPWRAERVSWVLDYAVGFFGGSVAARATVVDALSLAPLLGARIGTLSKGQRKRVLLAVGLIVPHPVLLCDEPFDGLDLRQTREVGAVLRAAAARGRTLFLSIHQISDAARVCDRFVLLSGGRAVGEGTAGELAARLPAGVMAPSLEEVVLGLT